MKRTRPIRHVRTAVWEDGAVRPLLHDRIAILSQRLSIVPRTLLLLALVCAVPTPQTCAQAPDQHGPVHIGDINFYGLRKTAPEKILSALELKAGATLPPSKGAMEERIEEISGVVQARVEAVCCAAASVTLFIGVEEKGSPHFDCRTAHAGN